MATIKQNLQIIHHGRQTGPHEELSGRRELRLDTVLLYWAVMKKDSVGICCSGGRCRGRILPGVKIRSLTEDSTGKDSVAS